MRTVRVCINAHYFRRQIDALHSHCIAIVVSATGENRFDETEDVFSGYCDRSLDLQTGDVAPNHHSI